MKTAHRCWHGISWPPKRARLIDHVASLHETEGGILDASGRPLLLLDSATLVRRALEMITAGGAVEPAR